jgi:hypothetical protein
MMQRSNIKFLAGVAALSVLGLGSTPALASEPFPVAIQEAASIPCTPSCTLCHGVDPGTATTFQSKELGKALFNRTIDGQPSVVGPGDTAALKKNFAHYAMDPLNAANVAALKAGTDPQTGADLCSGGPTYGCGAHIAKETPRGDASALLWVVGALVTAGVLRRRKPSSG